MNRRLLVVLGAVLLVAATAAAQQQAGGIRGVVKDETSAVVPGATVNLAGPATRNTVTGSDGGYHFDRLPPGTYKVTAILAGFRVTEKPDVVVTGGAVTDVPFQLVLALRGEELVVSASKVESALVDAPATLSVISSDTIMGSPAQNIGDILRTVPGVNVIQMSARDINVNTRAATSTLSYAELALLDGRSIYLDFFGLILWDFVPTNPSEIKQIEVVRGPASVVWGANALNGVINIITKTPRENAGLNLSLSGGIFDRKCDHCSFDGNGNSFGASASFARAINDTWSFKISGGYYGSDPFSRPTGQIEVIPDPRLDSPKCQVSVDAGGQKHGVGPDCVGGATYPAFENSSTKQPKVDVRLDQELSNGGRMIYQGGYARTKGIIHTGIGPFDIQDNSYMGYGRLGYTQGALKISAFGNFVNAEAPNLLAVDPKTGKPVQLNFKTQTYDLEIGHSTLVAERHLLSYGGNYRRNDFDITLAPEAKSNPRNDYGAYLQDEVFFGNFRLALGARIDKVSNLSDVMFSPRGALIYKPARSHSLRASVSKAFRAPSAINNYLDQNIVEPVDLSGLKPFLPPPYQGLVATPFNLVVGAVGSELPIGGQSRPQLKEQSVTAYEVGYTGTFDGKTTISLAFYINDNGRDINFASLASNYDPYTAGNPPPGWNQRFGPLGPILLLGMAQQGIFLPRTAFTYLNLGPTRDKGVEVSIDHAFDKEWSVSGNYSYQARPEVLEPPSGETRFPSGELAWPPKNRFNLGLHYDGKLFLGTVLLNHSDKGFWTDVLNAPYQGFTDAYNMLNATLGVKLMDGKAVISFKGTNLTNEVIQQHIFGDIMKRSLVAELRLSL